MSSNRGTTLPTTLPANVYGSRSRRSIVAGAGIALVALLCSCGSQRSGARGAEASTAGSANSVTPLVADVTTTTVAPAAATTASSPAAAPETTTTTQPPTTVPTTPASPPPTASPATLPPAPPTPPPPTVTLPPPLYKPIVAVDASGDAVIVRLDGTQTFLYDGADPDDHPEEGPSVQVAGVAVTADESVAIVGTCCEPSPGTLMATSDGVTQTSFGHAPVISPDGTKVGFITFGAIVVSALDLTNPITASVDGTGGATPDATARVSDLAWVDDTHLITLVIDEAGGSTLRLFELGESTLESNGSVSVEPAESLAGCDDGTVYTLTGPGVLKAYDAFLGTAAPADDIVLADQALSADVHDGEVRWVDHNRGLHIGAARIFGDYIWVR